MSRGERHQPGRHPGQHPAPHVTRAMAEASAAIWLEVLVPTEDKPITVGRSHGRVEFPDLWVAGATSKPADVVRLTGRPLEWRG
jgi:hypothetical protein